MKPTLPTESENELELAALARSVRRSAGDFTLYFARCNLVPLRKQLVAELQVGLKLFGLRPVLVELSERDDLSTLPELLAGAAKSGQPVFVYGLESLMPTENPWRALAALNHRRDSFHQVRAPVVFWVPEYVLQQIASRAGDFWAWRSGVYVFECDPLTTDQVLDEGTSDEGFELASLPSEAKRSRIRLLLALLGEYPREGAENLRIRAEVLLQLSLLHFTLGELDSGEGHALEVQQISREIAMPALEAAALGNLGFAYGNLGRTSEALDCLQRAGVIWKEIGDRSREGATLNHLGNMHRAAGDFEQARQCYTKALAIAIELRDVQARAEVLGSLGSLEIQQGNPERAVLYLEEALQIARQTHDRNSESVRLANLMLALSSLQRWDAAKQAGEQALAVARELGSRRVELNVLGNLGNTHSARGDLVQARACYGEALELARISGDRFHEAQILANLGNASFAAGVRTDAKQYYHQALDVARELRLSGVEAGILQNLSVLFKESGEDEAAHAASRLFHAAHEKGLDGSFPVLSIPIAPTSSAAGSSTSEVTGREEQVLQNALAAA